MGGTSKDWYIHGINTNRLSIRGDVSRTEVGHEEDGFELNITGNVDSQPNRMASSRGIEIIAVATRSSMGIVRIML